MDRWRGKERVRKIYLKKAAHEGEKHRKETGKRPSSVQCAHSCDSVTTARLLDLRDCCCQSLSPLFYCETMQVFPGVCVFLCVSVYFIR